MAPPAESSSPKRNHAAPKQLDKLDVDAERQKSIKRLDSSSHATQKTQKTSTGSATKTKPKKPPQVSAKKATKGAVVAVASGEDQFNDLGDAPPRSVSTNGNANEKEQQLPARGNKKPRPASAAVGAAKLAPLARPASAGTPATSNEGTILNRTNKKKTTKATSGGTSPVKSAFEADSETPAHTGMARDGDDGEETAAKGVYDIFVQTRRCEVLCEKLGLKLKHIRKMKKKFDDNDMYHSGEITQAEFFFILNEDRRPLTKGILQFGNVTSDQKFMSFDQFLLCVCSFASLTPPEVYEFAFDLYDDDKSGSLDEHEFTKMSKELQSKQFSFPKNVEMAIKMIEGKDTGSGGNGGGGGYIRDDGLVDLAEFMKFAKLFPVAFFPLFNFQKNVRKATLGESKWSNLAARKLKIQELVSHMRRNYGAIPELSLGARLWSIVDDEVMDVRKRASEIYGMELAQRRLVGEDAAATD